MKKIVFASDQLPAELDDQARFALWRDIYASLYGDALMTRLEDRPFSSRSEFTQVGDVGIVRCEGTFERYARTARHAAQDTRGDFLIGLLRRGAGMSVAQPSTFVPSAAALEVFSFFKSNARDLAGRCVDLLEQRKEIPSGALQQYIEILQRS
jgi:hypothetical protein